MSSQKQLRLVALGAEFYAGLSKDTKVNIEYPVDITEELKKVDKEQGIMIIFPEGYRYVQAEGDQEVGKTSFVNLLQEATGNLLPPNAINSIYDDKKFSFRTYGLDGFLYHIRGTKSTYTIERIETDEETGKPILNEKNKEIRLEVKSPKSAIHKITGTAGVSPLWLMNENGADQIKWLRGFYTLETEVLKQELDTKTEYETSYKARTKAGNESKRYRTLVNDCDYKNDREKWDKYFTETNFDDIEQQFKDAQLKYTEYQKAENGIASLKEVHLLNAKSFVDTADANIRAIEEQIKALQLKLTEEHNLKAQKVEAVNAIEKRIADGEKWIADNESVKTTYENMNNKIKEATEFNTNRKTYNEMLENEKQANHFDSEYERLTHRIDELAEVKKKLISMFSPTIEGFEVCVPDEEDKREGLYYHKKPLNQLAESELWELFTQLWAALNVRMVFVENISGLGSGAIAKFNEFITNGGYVFATLMNRSEKNLKITWATQIK